MTKTIVPKKWCPKCKAHKSPDEFHHNRRKTDGRACYCKTCAIADDRRAYLKKEYGMTLEEYELALASQKGRCAICRRHISEINEKYLHVDHDHKTKRVRSLLCGACNRALGLIKDDPEISDSMSYYLRGHGTFSSQII
jgi:hypothetical protein